jgi:hypothetical protein
MTWERSPWQRMSPRTWRYRTALSSDPWSYTFAEIDCVGYERWWLYISRDIDRKFIAEFQSWDEASGCAPMLIKLHESEHKL